MSVLRFAIVCCYFVQFSFVDVKLHFEDNKSRQLALFVKHLAVFH